MRCSGNLFAVLAVAASIGLAGCEADDGGGNGTLKVVLWGEEFIESGIPATEFADGWGITYERFLVSVGALSVAREGVAAAVSQPAFQVYDLAAFTGPRTLAEAAVPAGSYTHTAYTVGPAKADTTAANASAADLKRMVDGGLSVLVEGKATKAGRTVSFSWGFANTTVYDPCHSGGKVADGGTATVQLTIHGDHLFYDDAASEEPSLRFEDLALADKDANGTVTPEELKACAIAPLDHYGVGSLEIDNLWDYVTHMTTTLGHIDGEGHCETH
jgi:hypothetical protein